MVACTSRDRAREAKVGGCVAASCQTLLARRAATGGGRRCRGSCRPGGAGHIKGVVATFRIRMRRALAERAACRRRLRCRGTSTAARTSTGQTHQSASRSRFPCRSSAPRPWRGPALHPLSRPAASDAPVGLDPVVQSRTDGYQREVDETLGLLTPVGVWLPGEGQVSPAPLGRPAARRSRRGRRASGSAARPRSNPPVGAAARRRR